MRIEERALKKLTYVPNAVMKDTRSTTVSCHLGRSQDRLYGVGWMSDRWKYVPPLFFSPSPPLHVEARW